MRRAIRLVCLSAALLAPAAPRAEPAPGSPLAAIRATGRLTCGTVAAAEDWNGQDEHGDLSTLGTEICRAVGAAVLGAGARVDIVAFPGEPEALQAVADGGVQLAVGISPSAETAMRYGVGFGPPVYFDSQRFLVAEATGIKDVAGLRDRLVCAMENSPAERGLRDYMEARGVPYALQAHSEQGEMDASVAVARCLAGSAMESRLADSRADFPANAPPFVFLPERFRLAPVVPAFRSGDQAFGLIVQWTISAVIEAEALGIGQSDVEAAAARADMRAQRLLGGDFAVAQALGLQHDWAVRVIAAVGNYGEMFDRTLGAHLHLDRGYNALWTDGGLMWPMPMQ